MIARFVLGAGAIFAAAGLVGCGAGEQGSGDPGAIGSSSEALSVGSTLAAFPGTAVEWAASCVVTDNSRQKLLVSQGYDSTGASVDQTYLYDPVANTWTAFDAITDTQTAGNLNDTDYDSQGRGEAQFIPISSTKCLLVAGLSAKTGGATRTRSLTFDVSASAHHQWSKVGDMAEGRAKFGLSKCGTGSKVIAIGGHVAAGTGSPVTSANTVEVWNGSNAWSSFNKLNPRVSGFGFAAYSDNEHFVIGGGVSNTGDESKVQALLANDACDTITAATTDTLKDPANTANPLSRIGAVALFSAQGTVHVAAGSNSSSGLLTDAQTFTINWSGTPAVTYSSHTTTGTGLVPNGVRLPASVILANNKLVMLGGEDASASTLLSGAPQSYVTSFDVSSGTPVFASASGAATLSAVRIGLAATALTNASINSGNPMIYAATGRNASTTVTTLESITP
jgi:hypothetical protein